MIRFLLCIILITEDDDISLLIDYMRETGIIRPKIDKRISFYNQDIPTSMSKNTDHLISKNVTNNSSMHVTIVGKIPETSSKKSSTIAKASNTENLTPDSGFELTTVFGIMYPFLTDLERSFLESLISEAGKEEPIHSLDALEDHLKVKVKDFLKVETITVDNPKNIIPGYEDRHSSEHTGNGSVRNRHTVSPKGTDVFAQETVINATNKQLEKLSEKITFLTDSVGDHDSMSDVTYKEEGSNNDETSKEEHRKDETSEIPLSPTDKEDAQFLHELLLYSIVKSIIDKIKEKMLVA